MKKTQWYVPAFVDETLPMYDQFLEFATISRDQHANKYFTVMCGFPLAKDAK